MTKNCCCRCSAFFSCFSASNTPPSLGQAGVEFRDTQTLPSSPHVSISHGVGASSPIASLDANVHNDNLNAASSQIIASEHDPQTLPSMPHTSTSHASIEQASSSEVPAIVDQDEPPSDEAPRGSSSSTLPTVSGVAGSSSSTLPTVSGVAAVAEGDDVNVDLDELIKHISELLEHIQEAGKKSALAKAVQRYLPASKSFSKLKEFLSEATNFMKDIIPGDAKTIVRGLLQGMGTAHLATTGLLVVANILERFEDVSHNQDECLRLLKEMIFLAKVVKQIKERPQLQQRMHDEVKDATELIVEGSIKCCSQMASSQFSKFFSTSVNKEELGELAQQLDVKYKHIYIQMGIEIYDVGQCKKANLSRRYPEHAVGLEESSREVIDLLEWGSQQNAVAVILHGFGGMGKTTLADAVFSMVNIEGCQYSTVQLFENIHSFPKIIELQKLILRDLTRSENIPQIRKHEDGQRELSRVLEDVSAFIYIDNALGERELGQLLPEDLSKAKKVRLLITARDLNVRKSCPLKTAPKEYRMKAISSMEATNLWKMEMFGHMETIFCSYKVNHIIKKCGGIPLMLKLVARALRFAKDEQEVDQVLDELEKLKGEDFGRDKIESYLFAYDKLPEDCKDPFLDICSYFEGWDWEIVANIMGGRELKMLADRALITKNTNGVISVHDVILTLGRRKSQGVRFMFISGSQFKKFLDKKKEEEIQKIKGIWLSENKDLLPISATILDSMHKSLRILRLGKLTKIEGKCSEIFESLIFFEGVVPGLPFGVKELMDLKYLCYQPKDLKLLEIPHSLRHMEFDGRLHPQVFEMSSRDLELFKNLRILKLTGFAKLKKLSENLGGLVNGLQELTLSYCKSIEELPPSISELQNLRVLRMDYCSSLMKVPEGLGSLTSLQELNFQGCTNLRKLPNSLGKLISLRILDLSSCKMLVELPHGIENLTSLVNLSFHKCASLRSIPESIGRLKSSAFSMDMSCCSSLRELPNLFVELGNLRELNLSDCTSLEKLPKGFTQLKYLVKLNLSKCGALKELCNEFHCLLSLEILDLSGCKMLEELPPDFHCLPALENLYLSGCESLQKLTEYFHCLPSLQHLHLCYCPMLNGKWMDNLVKLKTLQFMNIQESNMLVERWGEIQTEGNQSCSFVVYTGQDLSMEEKKNILQKLLSELDCLLIDKQGNPFRLCDLPPNTLSLVMFNGDPNDDFPFPLIEESIDDIQIDFQMIYIGRHFNKFPSKVKDRILAHSHEISELIGLMVVKLLLTLDAEVLKSWLLTLEKYVQQSWLERYIAEEPICFKMEMMKDGNVGKDHSCWKVLSNYEIEEFVLGKCRRYLKLKELKETTQDSNILMLRELFATGDEETNHIFQKNCASSQDPAEHHKPFSCGVDKLIGKTILLEMRSVDVCEDTRLWSLSEMYLKEKDKLELEMISVPIVQTSTALDVLERFSKEVPWLVLKNPWMITRAVKYFLVKQCGMERDDIWYPDIIWIIEPNGVISTCKPSVLAMLNRLGPKAYPFTHAKFEELRNNEWNQWKNMSNLEFLFNHLESVSDQAKKMMFQGKIICLYSGNETEARFSITRKVLKELRDSIHVIYIPQFGSRSKETLWVTDNIYKDYYAFENFEMPQAEMEGMSLLNLSEHEAMKFWMRLLHLKEEINGMEDSDNQLCEMKRLLHSFQFMDEYHWNENEEADVEEEDVPFDVGGGCMTFMDEDGKMVASCRGVIMMWIFQDSMEDGAKRLMHFLIKVLREEGKQTDHNYSLSDLTKNMQTVAIDPENVDVDLDRLTEYTSQLLEMNKLYHILEFKKEGNESSRPKVTGQLYWPTSRGFSIYKNLLTDRTNANWDEIMEIIDVLIEDEDDEDEDEDENEDEDEDENKVLQEEDEDEDEVLQEEEDEDEHIFKTIKSLSKEIGEDEDEVEEEEEEVEEEEEEDEDEHIIKTINSIVKEIGEAHWAAAVLLATAHMLERPETVYANRKQYLAVLILLDTMYLSAICLKQLNERAGLPKPMKLEMKFLMLYVLVASVMCSHSSKFDSPHIIINNDDTEILKEQITIEDLFELQSKLAEKCTSMMDSVGDLKNESESELDSLSSEDDSDPSSAKGSPKSTTGDEYLASSSAPNATHDNDESEDINAASPASSSC